MFLVLITYLVPDDKVAPLRARHYEFIDRHFAAGVFLFGGQQVPLTGGFIVTRPVARDVLDGVLAEDPYLAAGVARHEVRQLKPMRAQPEVAGALGLATEGRARQD